MDTIRNLLFLFFNLGKGIFSLFFFYLCVSVEDVDELLLLDGADHDGPALGVDGQVLPRHDPKKIIYLFVN